MSLHPRAAGQAFASMLFLVLAGCGNAPLPRQDLSPGVPEAGMADAGHPARDEAAQPPALAAFSITSEPDTGCLATTTAGAIDLPTPAGLRLTDLQATAARRVASDLSGRGFVLFDAEGTLPSAPPSAVGYDTRIAASATGIVAAGIGPASTALVRRFDAEGTPLGEAVDVGPVKLGRPLGTGRSGDKSMVVWAADDDSLRAQIIGPTGALGAPVVLEEGAEFGDLSIAIAPSYANDGSDFAIFWSLYRVSLGAHRVYSALVGESGIVGLPRLVFGSPLAVRLVGAVSHEDGTTLLANRDGEPMVVPLDVLGRPVGAAHLFMGARDVVAGGGHGFARNGAEVALVARHGSGAPAFRRLDLSGAPKEGWICLDTPRAGDLQLAGITADGAGYAVVIAAPEGKTSLLRVDASGRGPLP